jgi:hypothetical protein
MAVSFIMMRVKSLDKDSWGNLKCVVRYLHSTRHMKLNLSVDNLATIRWWVNASHAILDNCRGHMASMMSIVKGAAISFSNTQKLNTKSSTESELVGADQVFSSILHTRYFLIEAQGYSIEQKILFQDNQSTMRLEVNDSFNWTKTHQMQIFLDLEVMYCPTEIMRAGVLAKPK